MFVVAFCSDVVCVCVLRSSRLARLGASSKSLIVSNSEVAECMSSARAIRLINFSRLVKL